MTANQTKTRRVTPPRPAKSAAPLGKAGPRKDSRPQESEVPAPKPPAGKLGVVTNLLRRPEGATIAQLAEATGWQAHSVRGALAGSLKRKHGLTIVGEPGDGGRVYRIAADQPA